MPQCFAHARHGYGESNPAADFASRGRFAELAELAAQLGVRLARLPVPDMFDVILREFHAAFPDRPPRKQPSPAAVQLTPSPAAAPHPPSPAAALPTP